MTPGAGPPRVSACNTRTCTRVPRLPTFRWGLGGLQAIYTPGPRLLSSLVLHRCSLQSHRLGEECGRRRDSGTWPLLCGTPMCIRSCMSPSPGHDFHVTMGCSRAHPARRPAGSGSSHRATDSLAAGQPDASQGRSDCSLWMWPILPPVCALSKSPLQTLIVFFTKS